MVIASRLFPLPQNVLIMALHVAFRLSGSLGPGIVALRLMHYAP
jgi:hypothetical protein